MSNLDNITDVKSLCKFYSGKKVFVYILGGNKGDGVIYKGGREIFNKYNVNYTEIYNLGYIKEPSDATLFVYGSGGFCSFFSDAVDLLDNLVIFKEVFILPSTFDCTVHKIHNFIAELPDNVVVFCRELTSYDQVKNVIKNKNNVKLDHDLAFHIDISCLDNSDKNTLDLLIAVRKDVESLKNWSIKDFSNDISNGTFFEADKFIEEINRYKTVVTDRAHVAIVGCLLGKKVFILPDGYHKVRSIYEYSLKGRYDAQFYKDNNNGFSYCRCCNTVSLCNDQIYLL